MIETPFSLVYLSDKHCVFIMYWWKNRHLSCRLSSYSVSVIDGDSTEESEYHQNPSQGQARR